MIEARFRAPKPEDVGVDSEKLEAVFARARRDVDEGVLPSAQVAVARNGKIAGMRTFGKATDETLYCIFSCTKAIVAAATWLLFEEGMLKLDERVAEIVPEFGTNGKDVVTVEQLMLHTGGFPYAPFRTSDWDRRDKLLEAFGRWRLNWAPGTQYEYHATSAHWVLSEIILRRTGKDFREVIRERITGPMGLEELFVGLPEEYDPRFAEVGFCGEITEPPGGWGEVTPDAILSFNGPMGRRVGIPGGGGVTSAGELALFYQTLINGGETHEGKRILKRDTIEFATTVRNRLPDRIFNVPANRGLSIIVAGDDGQAFMRGFGRVASPRSIGHGGAGGQIAWGDPETGISVGYCTNGFTDWMKTARRITAIGSLAAGCVA